jgi:hypothetical protein
MKIYHFLLYYGRLDTKPYRAVSVFARDIVEANDKLVQINNSWMRADLY